MYRLAAKRTEKTTPHNGCSDIGIRYVVRLDDGCYLRKACNTVSQHSLIGRAYDMRTGA